MEFLDSEYDEELKRLAEPFGEAVHDEQPVSRKLIDAIKNKRIVMLGEATHGTREFYNWRKKISLELIRNHGFSFISVEGDWPDCSHLNEYIQTGRGGSALQVLRSFHRWPTWMWSNAEVADLAEKMRGSGGRFYGLDVYSLYTSIASVLDYAKKFTPKIAEDLEKKYDCFRAFQDDEISYAYSLMKDPSGCAHEVVEGLSKLLQVRINHSIEGHERLFDAQQNARVIRNAESYYRAMLDSPVESWNTRDQHMLETLEQLLQHHGEEAKAIVWAHNTHVGDYSATDMGREGYVNLGGLAREVYGRDNVALIGFGSYEGTVTASSAWGSFERVMTLPKAKENSLDDKLHQICREKKAAGLTLAWPNEDDVSEILNEEILQRAVGVVYDPAREKRGNYVPTLLLNRYDGFVFVDQTSALSSLHTPALPHEIPETWPSGI
jgi:erythromycin esterase-like protein